MKFFSKKTPTYNLNHPELKGMIEFAFQVKGHKYYRFKDGKQTPAGRYKYVYAALREVDLRMDRGLLSAYIAEIIKCLNSPGDFREQIFRLLFNMKTRVDDLAFEPEGVRRLGAVTYFDDTEDLSTYDENYGKKKIEFWKKNNVTDFFLTRPISELLQLNGVSETTLAEYIQTSEQIIQDLNSGLSNLSGANLSENGKKTS